MKHLFERWRNFLHIDEEKIVDRWSRATGTSRKKLLEGISRRDFLKGLGSVAMSAAAGSAMAGDTSDTGISGRWVPPDEDERWMSSEWTGLGGYAMIHPGTIKEEDALMGGAYNVSEYRKYLSTWTTKSLAGALIGSGATATHGNPSGGATGYGLDRFSLKDDRSLGGRIKLPITWSLMLDEYSKREDREVRRVNPTAL